MAIGFVRSTLDWFAKLGLTVRDDAPKAVDIVGRDWGEPAGGLALSIERIQKEDPAQLPAISAAVRNVSCEQRRFEIPDWLVFYSIEVTGPHREHVQPTAFGRELLKPERHRRTIVLDLAPGQAVQTDIPIASIFDMRAKGEYGIRASAVLAGGETLRSNSIAIAA